MPLFKEGAYRAPRGLGMVVDNGLLDGQRPSVFDPSIMSGFRIARKDYITAKYMERRYARKKHADTVAKLHSLCEAVKSRDIFGLLQAYADGVDLTEKIPLANGHVSGAAEDGKCGVGPETCAVCPITPWGEIDVTLSFNG